MESASLPSQWTIQPTNHHTDMGAHKCKFQQWHLALIGFGFNPIQTARRPYRRAGTIRNPHNNHHLNNQGRNPKDGQKIPLKFLTCINYCDIFVVNGGIFVDIQSFLNRFRPPTLRCQQLIRLRHTKYGGVSVYYCYYIYFSCNFFLKIFKQIFI